MGGVSKVRETHLGGSDANGQGRNHAGTGIHPSSQTCDRDGGNVRKRMPQMFATRDYADHKPARTRVPPRWRTGKHARASIVCHGEFT